MIFAELVKIYCSTTGAKSLLVICAACYLMMLRVLLKANAVLIPDVAQFATTWIGFIIHSQQSLFLLLVM